MDWLRGLSLIIRVRVISTIGLIALLAGIGLFGARLEQASTRHVLDERLRATELAAARLDVQVQETLGSLERVTQLAEFDFANADGESKRRVLRDLLGRHLLSYAIFATDKAGVVRWVEPDRASGWNGFDLTKLQAVRTALASGKPQASILVRDTTLQNNLLFFLVPVHDSKNGAPAGWIGGAMDPSTFNLADLSVYFDGATGSRRIQIVDNEHNLLAPLDATLVSTQSRGIAETGSLIGKGQSGLVTVSDGEALNSPNQVLAYAPLANAPWGVLVDQSEAEMVQSVGDSRPWLLLISGLAVVVIGGLALFTMQGVIRPLSNLSEKVRRIGAGDLDTPIPVTGRDEIAQLGSSLEATRQKLAAWDQEIELAVHKRTRQLSIMYAIDRAAAQSLDLDEILKNALERMFQVLLVDAVAIYVAEPNSETMVLRAHRGLSEEYVSNLKTLPGEGEIARAAIQRMEPVIFRTADFPRERISPYLIREGFRVFVCIPLVSVRVAVGVLHLGLRGDRVLPPEELELLVSIGRQLGGAVQNARLYGEVSRNLARITDLYELSTAILSATTVEDAAQVVGDRVIRAARAHSAIITLVDTQGQITLHTGISQEGVWRPEQLPSPEAATMTIVQTGELLIQPAPDAGPESHLASLARSDIQSFVGLPLKVGLRVTGVLFVRFTELHWFSAEEIQALKIYANQAATALERARLHQETEHRAERLAVLNRIARVAGATLEQAELIDVAYREITAALKADGFFLALYDQEAQELDYQVLVHGLVRESPRRRPVGTGLAWRMIGGKEPVIIYHLDEEREHYAELDVWGSVRVPQSWLGAPILVGGAVLGVMSVQAYHPNAYGEDELRLFTTIADQLGMAIENARLYEAEHRRALRLASILRLSTEIAALPDERTLAETLVERTMAISESTSCSLLLMDPSNQSATLAAHCGLAETVPGAPFPLILPIFRQAITKGEPIILGDIDRQAPEVRTVLVRADIAAFFAFPMLREGRVLGLITLSSTRPRALSSEEVTIYMLMAERAASAWENVRLNQETRQRLSELSAIFQVSAALREAPNVETMLPIILRQAMDAIKADTASLSLLVGERVVCRGAIGDRERIIGQSVGLGEGITGLVAATGQMYVCNDFQQDQARGHAPRRSPELDRIQSDLCVPLKTAEQVIGVMHISTFVRRDFAEGDVHLITAIADMAASAIHRAGLFEQLEERVQDLATLFEVGKAVTSSLRLQDVFKLVAEIAPRALVAEGCYLFLWDEVQQLLVMRAAAGLGPQIVDHLSYQRGEGLAGWVFLENRPANVHDVPGDPRWKVHPELEAVLPSGKVQTALVLPLRTGIKTLGVIGVMNKVNAPAFTESDESLLNALAGQIAIAIDNARLYEDVRGLSISIIRSLATAIDARDPYTRGHSEGVARLAVLVAQSLDWSSVEVEKIEFAALLHDVGKIAVPDNILRNTGSLTPAEWTIIHLHPYHSAQILKPVESLHSIIPWIYHHQEKWDGTGYPDGLRGEAIPIGSRIIAVADAFNAMTTDRPYRKALPMEAALDELRSYSGTQFDSAIVKKFLRAISRNPPAV